MYSRLYIKVRFLPHWPYIVGPYTKYKILDLYIFTISTREAMAFFFYGCYWYWVSVYTMYRNHGIRLTAHIVLIGFYQKTHVFIMSTYDFSNSKHFSWIAN